MKPNLPVVLGALWFLLVLGFAAMVLWAIAVTRRRTSLGLRWLQIAAVAGVLVGVGFVLEAAARAVEWVAGR